MNLAQVNMVSPVNWLHPVNRNLLGHWMCLPGTVGGRGLMDLTKRTHLTWFTSSTYDRPLWVGVRNGLAVDKRRASWGAVEFSGEAAGGARASFAGNNALLRVDSQTFACWAYATNFGNQRMLGGACDNVESGGYEWSVDTSGKLAFAYFNGSIRGWYAGTAVTAGAWYHHVGVVNYVAGTVRFYVNGVFGNEVSINIASAMVFNNDTFDIGHASTNISWLGYIDDVRLYRGTKTDAEVRQLYEESVLGYPYALNRVQFPRALQAAAATGNRRRRFICGAA